MKTVLALSLALFAACIADHTSTGSQNQNTTNQACTTDADCPPNELCIPTGTTTGTTSTVPAGVCHIPVDPLICATNADCPPGDVCIYSTTSGTPTTTGGGTPHGVCGPGPTTNSCSASTPCPTGERCNPICSTTGTVGYQCQPDGVPTQQCPVPCVSDSDCPLAGERCMPRCQSTSTTPEKICGFPQSASAVCL